MNILHYSLGLPPYRSGGLTKYSMDIMIQQQINGHNVSLLYPGGVSFIYPHMHIRKKKNTIPISSTYELQNPLPVPLLHGIQTPSDFCNEHGFHKKHFAKFLKRVQPHIIHIHTLMGLPLGLILLAKELNIKVVFSTHDYFGLCMKVNLINEQQTLCNRINVHQCSLCNASAPSSLFIRLRNEPWIFRLKNKIAPYTKQIEESNNKKEQTTKISPQKEVSYNKLKNYYYNIFQQIDKFHFNSSITANVYTSLIPISNSVIIPITHQDITDNRHIKHFSKDKLKIGFIGNITPYKGFPTLKKTLKDLPFNINWELNVYGGVYNINNSNIICRGKYTMRDLKNIYDYIDVLIVPSICKETFGFVVLEALSYGVPVITSNNVGAKDLVAQYNPSFVYDTKEELAQLLTAIYQNKNILEEFNHAILSSQWKHSIKEHIKELELNLYN